MRMFWLSSLLKRWQTGDNRIFPGILIPFTIRLQEKGLLLVSIAIGFLVSLSLMLLERWTFKILVCFCFIVVTSHCYSNCTIDLKQSSQDVSLIPFFNFNIKHLKASLGTLIFYYYTFLVDQRHGLPQVWWLMSVMSLFKRTMGL